MNDTTRGTTGYYGSNDQSVAVYVQDPRTSQVSAQVQVPDQVGCELEQLPLALMLQKNLCSSLSLTFFGPVMCRR